MRASRSVRPAARPATPTPTAPEVRDGVGAAAPSCGQRLAHRVGGQPQLGDEQDGAQVARRVEAERLDAVRRRGRHDEPTEQRGGGVVGVALDRGRDAQLGVAVERARPSARSPATTPATVAAADEPRPRASGIWLRMRDPPADALRELAAPRDERRLEAADEPVVAVLGQLVAALAVDRQLDLAAAPAADLDLDPVHQLERHARGSRSPRRGSPTTRGPRR